MFNNGLLIGARLRNNTGRHEFAAMIGVSYSYLLKLERGAREPSLDILRKIVDVTGISADDFIRDCGEPFSPEKANGPGQIKSITVFSDDSHRDRYLRKELEERLSEVERFRDHALIVIALQEKYITILIQDVSQIEKGKKTAALARLTAREGEIRFDEIQKILRQERRTLKNWLESEKTAYACKLFQDKSVVALTPGEAGMLLACFDCTPREKGDCSGYGDNSNPENIAMLVLLFEANGINNREEIVRILNESYDMDLTAHKLSEILYKIKHGKRIADDVYYLKCGRMR